MQAYRWKTTFYKAKPETAAEVFKELEGGVGLTAKNVVDVSRPLDAPLHNEFEWNNDTAAEKYRQYQARVMIQNLEIVITSEKEDEKPVNTRAYVTLQKTTKPAQFENIQTVLSTKEKRDALLDMAKHDMIIFKAKYAHLKELASVIVSMDEWIQNDEG